MQKNHENIDRKRLPIMQPFSLRFGTPKTSLLGPNLEPSWLSRRPKRPPRSPQVASKTDPGTFRMVQTAPSCSKGRPESPPGFDLDPPDFDFGPSRPRFSTLQTSTLSLSETALGAVAGRQLCCAVGFKKNYT